MQTKRIVFILALLVLIPGITLAAAKYTKNTHSVYLEKASSQYLIAPSSPSLNISGDLTLEAWVKLDSLPEVGQVFVFIAKWGETSGPGSAAKDSYLVELDNTSGTPMLDFGISGFAFELPWTPTLHTWHHVAVVYETTGNAGYYVDGSLLGTASGFPNSVNITDAPLLIGQHGERIAHPVGLSGFFDGHIDEVRIYNVARSQEEILSDYIHEVSGKENSLVAYWQLDKSLKDETNNHNDLNNVNGASFPKDKPFDK